MPPPPPTSPDRSTQRAALIVATLTSFLGPFMGSSVNVALPSIGREFALSALSLGWVNMAFILASAAFSIPFGRLGDIYGRKRIYLTGVAVFTLASVLIALATSGATLIIFRGLQGLGASMIFATGMAILISVYPPQQRGRVLGINVAAVYLGLSSGPFFGGFVTQYLGWRYLFWINLPIGLFLLSVIFYMLRAEWAEARGARFDWSGTVMLVVSLALTMYAFAALPRPRGYALLAFGLLGLLLFGVHQQRARDPLVAVRALRHNRVFVFSSLAALINYAATFAVSFLLSLYLQRVRGLSPPQTGIVLVSQPLIQAILSPLAGRLSDRIEPRTVASLGMGISFVGVGLLHLIDTITSLGYLVGCMVLLGFGFALFSSPNTKAIMNSVERAAYGVASAVVGTMRQVGMGLSMGIVVMIVTLHLGQAEIQAGSREDFVLSMRQSFTVFAGMCFAGIFASLARGREDRRSGSNPPS